MIEGNFTSYHFRRTFHIVSGVERAMIKYPLSNDREMITNIAVSLSTRASNEDSRRLREDFTIMEKAPTRVKAPTITFSFQTL